MSPLARAQAVLPPFASYCVWCPRTPNGNDPLHSFRGSISAYILETEQMWSDLLWGAAGRKHSQGTCLIQTPSRGNKGAIYEKEQQNGKKQRKQQNLRISHLTSKQTNKNFKPSDAIFSSLSFVNIKRLAVSCVTESEGIQTSHISWWNTKLVQTAICQQYIKSWKCASSFFLSRNLMGLSLYFLLQLLSSGGCFCSQSMDLGVCTCPPSAPRSFFFSFLFPDPAPLKHTPPVNHGFSLLGQVL